MSGFHGAFATGVACQQGTITLPDTWFPPPFWDLLVLLIVENRFLKLAMFLLDFSPRYFLDFAPYKQGNYKNKCILNTLPHKNL